MTGCERILARLERGPATAAELYAETFTIVHSRISDLRRQGYAITCERVPGKSGAASYLYTIAEPSPLFGSADDPSGVVGDDAPSPVVAGADGSPQAAPLGSQLSLVEAA